MSGIPRFAWQDGRVRPIEQCGVSLLDRGLLFSESIYEVLPVVGGRVRLVSEHGERMRAGAGELGIAAAVPDDAGIEALGEALLEAEGLTEGILYMQVTGGVGPRTHAPTVRPQPQLFAFVQPHALPRADDAARPRSVATARDPRWARCDLKTTMLLPAILARREHGDVDEIVFWSDDDLLAEGGSTCVLIVEGDTVVLPPLSPRVLPSVTRRVLVRLAAAEGIAVVEAPIDRARLLAADEIGLASTTKLVLGVGTVDGTPVSHRPAGMCTRLAGLLRGAYGLDDAVFA